jgi:acyl-CoA synthetase (AMP-forming)/AMP-acid ligase II
VQFLLIQILVSAEATKKAMTKDGFLKSGDLAYVDAQGLVYICDRGMFANPMVRVKLLIPRAAKDMIIRGGENIVSSIMSCRQRGVANTPLAACSQR